ncbi:glycosyltransferase family 4 protein [Scytonema millei VB511283]|uniref:Glycosyltransferase family 4 protein n=1 Tax=Scytonema millei VB511283 TaxID=1245923 RepID=A0A9X5EAY8_9CYAN|nr:glycosyltransferase family 4 protein [Scytonema millei VB511283]
MCVAIAHDQLSLMGGIAGSEKVLLALRKLFSDAPVYTTLYNSEKIPDFFSQWDIRPSFIQKLPGAKTHYQMYLPLMPTAVEQLNFDGYDLVISSHHSVIKGIITPPETLHICYCHSPMRYAWDLYHLYLKNDVKQWQKPLVPWLMNYLRTWDRVSADRVDEFIANSHHVARRIKKYYRREAKVIYPPVDIRRFISTNTSEDFYLMVGRIVAYKRHDLAIEAFNKNGRNLIIIGDGPERSRLESPAKKNIKFLGRQSDDMIVDYMQRCRGFIFPGEEDFGIAPVEAMACGKPVIAYKKGGAIETVVEGVTGIFFVEATADSLNEAILALERVTWSSEQIATHTTLFSQERFSREIIDFLEIQLNRHQKRITEYF